MNQPAINTTKNDVESVCELLREKISSGKLSTDGKIPSVRKLADLVGYPRHTVWRALLDLKEELYVSTTATGRYRVHPRFRLNYYDSKTLKIAFVGTGNLALDNSFIQRVYNALANNQDGFNIELGLQLGTEEKKVGADTLTGYDAVVLAASWSFPFYDALKRNGQFVTSLTAPLLYHLPCDVRIDNFHGGEIAGDAFCNLPIKKAVLLGESQYYPNQWHEDFELRTLGFRRAWLQHGRISQEIQECPLPEDLLPRLRVIEKIVSAQQEVTGYFALSDETALLLMSVLRDRKLRVPEDALIIGFDDSPEAANAGLASLHPDPVSIAEKLILQIRTQETDKDYQEILYVKPCLIARKSIGPS